MVMHYNHDTGDYGPYMLDDYTEDLASQHSVRNLIGDEFTLANLKAKFQEIMSMNVTPSTNTNLLNVKFDWEGNMIDKTTGETVEDGSSGSDSSGDDSSDSSYDDEPMILLMMTGPTIVPMMTVMTVLTMMEPTIVPMMMEVMTTPAIIRLFYESHHFVSRPGLRDIRSIFGCSFILPHGIPWTAPLQSIPLRLTNICSRKETEKCLRDLIISMKTETQLW